MRKFRQFTTPPGTGVREKVGMRSVGRWRRGRGREQSVQPRPTTKWSIATPPATVRRGGHSGRSGEPLTDDELDFEATRIGQRLTFLETLGRLWKIAALLLRVRSRIGPLVDERLAARGRHGFGLTGKPVEFVDRDRATSLARPAGNTRSAGRVRPPAHGAGIPDEPRGGHLRGDLGCRPIDSGRARIVGRPPWSWRSGNSNAVSALQDMFRGCGREGDSDFPNCGLPCSSNRFCADSCWAAGTGRVGKIVVVAGTCNKCCRNCSAACHVWGCWPRRVN